VLLPITHEDMTARRWPVATSTIVALCLALFVAGPGAAHGGADSNRFGFVPAEEDWLTLITSQFVHAGWLHLIFNMWFLWLCGCNLEDRWGRFVFALFYLSGGAVAALTHKIAFPHSLLPLVGASGSVAAAMGAFLVSFARTRIRFAYFYSLRFGTFTAPAYSMLPLWLIKEALFGAVQRDGAGVAHLAHVGGFLYGVAFAFVLRATGWAARLDSAVEKTVSVVQDERIMRAAELTNGGNAAEALGVLAELERERPEDIDLRLEVLRAGRAAGDRPSQVRAYGRLVTLCAAQGMLDAAYDLLVEAQRASLDEEIPPEAQLRLADRCVVAGSFDLAWGLYDTFTRAGLPDPTAVKVALAQAKLARRMGRVAEERSLLEAVLQSPFASVEIDESARAALSALDAMPG
jgi:membrane associated rhomboid family serine protease